MIESLINLDATNVEIDVVKVDSSVDEHNYNVFLVQYLLVPLWESKSNNVLHQLRI